MKFITIFDPKNEIDFVSKFKIAGVVAVSLPIISLVCLFSLGMPWGIDFLGGLEMQMKFPQPVSSGDIRETLDNIGFEKNLVQQFGASQNNEMLIRVERNAALEPKDVDNISQILRADFPTDAASPQKNVLFDEKSGSQLSIWLLDPSANLENDPFKARQVLDQQRRKLADTLALKGGVELRKTRETKGAKPDIYGAVLADDPQNGLIRYTVHFAGVSSKIKKSLEAKFGQVEIRRVDYVDSQVSRQLRTDGLLAVIYALLAIVIYIAIRFDLFFSPGAIVALIVDTLGALFVFSLGRIEFDTPSIAAMLTIVGYSINNTIVIYDRIREIVPQNPKTQLSVDQLKPYVNKAINDTLSRTINTTLTTLFASVAIWIFAVGVIESFAMVLTVGIIFGAFSSTFVAPSVYLLSKKYLKPSGEEDVEVTEGPSREDKARGLV